MPEEIGRLKINRAALDLELRNSWKRKYFSPAMLGLYRTLIPRLKLHATGKFLDAGCGRMPFRSYVEGLVDVYVGLDIERKVPELDLVGDLQNIGTVASSTYDAVLCSDVLEHLPQPARAISEVHRILRPQGKFILTVPYLSRLHDEPHDYFRYTKHGLRFLLRNGRFKVIEIVPIGSVFSFLGHQFATLAVCGSYHVPIFKHLVFWLNAALCVLPCYWLDRLPGLREKIPLGYVAVALKE